MIKAEERAKQIFDSLTEAQKNHIQDIFNTKTYWDRSGNKEMEKSNIAELIAIENFLTAGEVAGVYCALDNLLYDYNKERYNKEQKATDDMLLGK